MTRALEFQIEIPQKGLGDDIVGNSRILAALLGFAVAAV